MSKIRKGVFFMGLRRHEPIAPTKNFVDPPSVLYIHLDHFIQIFHFFNLFMIFSEIH